MTDTAGPFDGIPWAEAQWARHAAAWAPSGVYGTPAASSTTGDLPLSVSGRSVGLGAGRAWVRGFGFERTGAAVMVDPGANTHASFSRRDRIVLRRNLATHTITQVVLPGTPASPPVAPAITQSETGSWDLPLFSFLVPPASGTSITGIVDERAWIGAAGYVPLGVERTAGVVGLPVAAAGTATPSGPALTLPPLPVGHTFAIELTTRFYVENTAPNALQATPVLTNASRVYGDPSGSIRTSSGGLSGTGGLDDTVTTRWLCLTTSSEPVTLGSTYTAGPGPQRVILRREDWLVRL